MNFLHENIQHTYSRGVLIGWSTSEISYLTFCSQILSLRWIFNHLDLKVWWIWWVMHLHNSGFCKKCWSKNLYWLTITVKTSSLHYINKLFSCAHVFYLDLNFETLKHWYQYFLITPWMLQIIDIIKMSCSYLQWSVRKESDTRNWMVTSGEACFV